MKPLGAKKNWAQETKKSESCPNPQIDINGRAISKRQASKEIEEGKEEDRDRYDD